MLILAIDTTGFTSSISVIEDAKRILINKSCPGFLPDKKWKEFLITLPHYHKEFLLAELEKLFKNTKIKWRDIDAIAVSANSGIYNCILVGLSMAETLAYCHKKPLVKVDHILAHIYSPWIERDPTNFRFPVLVFSASGTHSNFSLLSSIDKYELISDQVGVEDREIVKTFTGVGKLFYAISRVLDIDVPKGDVRKVIQKMSQGDSSRFNFIKYYHGELLNLDFSDFMRSAKRFVEKEKKRTHHLSSKFIKDVAASFQEAIAEILSEKLINLAEIKNARELHLTGGVSLNVHFRKKLKEKIKKKKLSLVIRYPVKKEYSLDNAAMIGALAYYQQKYHIKFINFEPKITK